MAGISFRPTPEAERALALLMERWMCTRSHAINRAIRESAEVSEEQAPQGDRPKRKVSRQDSEQVMDEAVEKYESTLQRLAKPGIRRQTVPKPGWKC